MTNYLEYITGIEKMCVGNMILKEYAKIRATVGRTMALIKIGTIQRLTDYLKEQKHIDFIYDWMSAKPAFIPEVHVIRSLYSAAKNMRVYVSSCISASLLVAEVTRFRRYQKDILNLILPNFPLCQKHKPEPIKLERMN